VSNNDQNLSFSIRLPYKVQCQLPDCRGTNNPPVVTNRPHRVNLDGYNISFCSNQHARVGVERWQEKVKMGIKPGQPLPKEEDTIMTGDNLGEIENG
jgi:hypothetical protein